MPSTRYVRVFWKVRLWLEDNPGSTTTEIAAGTGFAYPTIRRYLNAFDTVGMLVEDARDSADRRFRRYRIHDTKERR